MKILTSAAVLAMALGVSAARAEECQASFPLESGTGYFTGLILFNFGSHMELQADTPSQAAAGQFTAAIDGVAVQVHASPGLDDLLVVFSTDPADLEVSPEFLGLLAKGKRFTLSAMVVGKPERADFSLAGSAAKIRRVKAGCK